MKKQECVFTATTEDKDSTNAQENDIAMMDYHEGQFRRWLYNDIG